MMKYFIKSLSLLLPTGGGSSIVERSFRNQEVISWSPTQIEYLDIENSYEKVTNRD